MTDDERMDRAERIRQMREGNRAASESADAADERVTEQASEETDADDSTAAPADGDATPAGTPAPGMDADSDTGPPAANPADTHFDDAAEAQAAAERAAQAAAQMTDTAAGEGASGAAGDADQPTASPGAAADAGQPAVGPTGVELPGQDLLEAALDEAGTERETATPTGMEERATQSEELVRVLEFALGEEHYCLDIEYVEEIVKREAVTRVPNTPAYIEGVVDLRGQITTILDPKVMMDIDDGGAENLIVVFDPEMFEEQGAVGWVVDEVRQVAPVHEHQVNVPPVDADYINGVIDREDQEQFVIWVEPEAALTSAVGESED